MRIGQLRLVDPEDREALKGKSDNYIMGWNKVKHRNKTERPVRRKPRKRTNV